MGNLTAGNCMLIACLIFFAFGTFGVVRSVAASHKANKKRKQYAEAFKNIPEE